MAESRKLAAILAADVVGFSRMAGVDEDLTLARLRTLRSDLVDPTISANNGRVVKRTGDGALVEFRSAFDAIRCAIEVQSAMVERNAGVPEDRRIVFRIGVHLGDVTEEADGDLMGNGVNIAARLEAIAEPGSVYLSQPAYEQVRDKVKEEFVDLGERELKNIVHPVHVYAVKIGVPLALSTEKPKDSSATGERRSARSLGATLSYALIGFYALLFVVVTTYIFYPHLKGTVEMPQILPAKAQSDFSAKADATNEPSLAKIDQRTFVSVSPKFLMSLYDNNMNLQADKLFSDFSGKWMRLSGRVGNLRPTSSGNDILLVFDNNNLSEQSYMFFDLDWKDRLSTLIHDQNVNVECQLSGADRYSVTFQHCRTN